MLILSTAYFGNMQYYSKLLQSREPVTIDLGEHYCKQSARSRCEILGANGVMTLSVPVYKTSGEKTPVHAVRIDPTKGWQHRHWQSIRSAYRNAPYFDHYAEVFEPIFHRPYTHLWALNRDAQQAVLDALEVKASVSYSDSYIESGAAVQDWRDGLSDKPRRRRPDPDFVPAPYWQVFSERRAFVPNLSVLDVLFCEGPGAMAQLLK